MITKEQLNVNDLVPNPIIIKSSPLKDDLSEIMKNIRLPEPVTVYRAMESQDFNIGRMLPEEFFEVSSISPDNYKDVARRSVFFSFLAVVMHSPMEDENFLFRFNIFDRVLFQSYKNTPEVLNELREKFQKYFNEVINRIWDQKLMQ